MHLQNIASSGQEEPVAQWPHCHVLAGCTLALELTSLNTFPMDHLASILAPGRRAKSAISEAIRSPGTAHLALMAAELAMSTQLTWKPVVQVRAEAARAMSRGNQQRGVWSLMRLNEHICISQFFSNIQEL